MTADGEAVIAAFRAAIVQAGWSATARRCGVDRVALHRAFSRKRPRVTRAPNLATLDTVGAALGLRLVVEKIPEADA